MHSTETTFKTLEIEGLPEAPNAGYWKISTGPDTQFWPFSLSLTVGDETWCQALSDCKNIYIVEAAGKLLRSYEKEMRTRLIENHVVVLVPKESTDERS